MKKILFLLLLIAGIYSNAGAQKEKRLKKIIELKVPLNNGNNGASVTWHPVTKRYYAALAGDENSFLGVYDARGKRISPPMLRTGFDVRGLWYNPHTQTIEMNGYKEEGWAAYVLDSNGFPREVKRLHPGLHQPNDQSVAAYDSVKNLIYFSFENTVLTYDPATAALLGNPVTLKEEEQHKKEIEKKAGSEGEEEEEEGGSFNTVSLVFTGIKNKEFGLLNYEEKRIVLFNRTTGERTAELSLPKNIPVYSLLNFSYCNGLFWLYDKKAHAWIGLQ